MRNLTIIATLLLSTGLFAQQRGVTKDVDVRVENGETTVTVTETSNGETTTEVMTGAEAEEYVATEKAGRGGTHAKANERDARAEVRVIREVEVDEDDGEEQERRRYTYTTTGTRENVFVTDNNGEGYTSNALKLEVSDDKRSVVISGMPPSEGEATLTIEGPGDRLISKEELAPGKKFDHTIDLKEHGMGDYTAKLEQGGTVVVKKLVIE